MSTKTQALTVEVVDAQGSRFTLHEICEHGECHAEFVLKMVNYGIIEPVEARPDIETRYWQFDLTALMRLRKAIRLQRDLRMNLPGLAMSLDLLDEVDTMRREIAQLRQQLSHFENDSDNG
jgi:chaperone modulatory protein CbpM